MFTSTSLNKMYIIANIYVKYHCDRYVGTIIPNNTPILHKEEVWPRQIILELVQSQTLPVHVSFDNHPEVNRIHRVSPIRRIIEVSSIEVFLLLQ